MDMLSYLMNEFTFEYDVEKDVLSFSEKYHTIFQRGRNFIRFRETIQSHYTVYHMDISKLQEVYEDVKGGKEEGSVLFRLQMTGGNYEWFRAVYKVMYSADRKPKYVVGKMLNVHQSQTEKEMLLTKSTRDPLTNLLNRSEMEKRTNAYIETMDSEDLAALLIMDLDHFKQVNDTFGHSKGDDLLRDVAAVIRDSFRTNDIVARLGGDEFFVFMKDIASDKDAVNKCEKLRLALYRDVTYGEQTVKISASMGIIFVKQGAQFLDIYMKADSALYRAKENGRNQICTYSEEPAENTGAETTEDVTG
jgi:putative two-component system response regulator